MDSHTDFAIRPFARKSVCCESVSIGHHVGMHQFWSKKNNSPWNRGNKTGQKKSINLCGLWRQQTFVRHAVSAVIKQREVRFTYLSFSVPKIEAKYSAMLQLNQLPDGTWFLKIIFKIKNFAFLFGKSKPIYAASFEKCSRNCRHLHVLRWQYGFRTESRLSNRMLVTSGRQINIAFVLSQNVFAKMWNCCKSSII